MTKISFQLTDDNQLPVVITWLNNLGVARDIKTEKIILNSKQTKIKNNIQASLKWVEQHQKGEVEGKPAYDLVKELEQICKKPK